jgi:hypothetical protein
LLYAFFNLALAVSGDLGIAISLAAESTLVRLKLVAQLSGYANADEVGNNAITLVLYLTLRALDDPQESRGP